MDNQDYSITLSTTIKELKKHPQLNRNTLFLQKEFGASNMEDILNINPYKFKEKKGVGPVSLNDLFRIQEQYKHLKFSCREESAKLIDKAAQICVSKHAGQRDKMGSAYFQHPMRVAMRCTTDEEKMVALLHDTIEDTDVTADYLLAEGFPQSVVDGILSVTKRDGETYEDFVARAKQNPLGRVVKLHDLEDNLDVFRLDAVSPEMAARFTKYLAAHRFLLEEDKVREETLPEKEPEELPDETSDNPYTVTRVVISRSESHRQQRARINQRLINFRSNGGTEYMQNKISVLMPDRKIIAEYATYSSFMQVVEYIGFERVAELGMKYGQYPIVTKKPIGNRYAKANGGWYVLSNWPTPVVAQYVNDIADALDLYIECDVVPK